MQYATIPPENFGPHLHIETNPVAENGHTWTNLLAENLNQWSIVFIVFLIELGLCSSIIFPVSLNLRSQLIYNLARLWDHNHRFRLVIKTLMFIMGCFFFDALRHMYTLYDSTSVYGTTNANPGLQAGSAQRDAFLGYYKAERNAYLCGFTLFLFFLLHRFAHQTARLSILEDKVSALDTTKGTPVTSAETGTYVGEHPLREGVPLKSKIR